MNEIVRTLTRCEGNPTMHQIFWRSLLISSAVFRMASGICAAGAAEMPAAPAAQSPDPGDAGAMEQITSVSQLSDVQPADWAFQALQNLAERYGCAAGYPDGTYRGNRALSRYEFAVGLNACLEKLRTLISQTDTSHFITKQDLATLNRLAEEFQAEFAALRSRADILEARTSEIQANEFSPTAKLNGEIIFAASDAIGDGDPQAVPAFQQRTWLNIDASFTGKDRLRTRLQIGNVSRFPYVGYLTNEGRLAFDTNTENQVYLSDLIYRFPLGERATASIIANGGTDDKYANVITPFFSPPSTGALSSFGRRNPIYLLGGLNTGVGLEYNFSSALKLTLGYLAGEANKPSPGNGFFNGDYHALAQLEFRPSRRAILGLTYVHSYDDAGVNSGSGSLASRLRFQKPDGSPRPAIGNSYGVEASFALSPRFAIGGWAGYTAGRVTGLGDGEVWNWALTLAFPDLGKEGNLGGILVGMEPKLTGGDFGSDPDTGLHIEAFYRDQLTDNISITPGVIWLTAPGHSDSNSDIVTGTVRTTFKF